MKRARILLADDHALVLAGIRSLLEPHYDVVGEAADGRSLVEEALRLRPDLVILDITMPMLNGIEAARQIKKSWPRAKLLFLSMHANALYLREAFDAGGSGYVLKSSASEELRIAVRRVLDGGTYVAPRFGGEVIDRVLSRSGRPAAELTTRQREVLQLVAEGRTNKEVAAILNVSIKTVEFHRGQIMRRLGLRSIAELTRFAVQSGFVGE